MLLVIIIVINIIITALLMLIIAIYIYHNQYKVKNNNIALCRTCIYLNEPHSAKTKART